MTPAPGSVNDMGVFRRFVALRTFECEPLGSSYCEGLTYTVRTDELAEYAAAWEAQGLIRFVSEGSGIAGTGQITNTRD